MPFVVSEVWNYSTIDETFIVCIDSIFPLLCRYFTDQSPAALNACVKLKLVGGPHLKMIPVTFPKTWILKHFGARHRTWHWKLKTAFCWGVRKIESIFHLASTPVLDHIFSMFTVKFKSLLVVLTFKCIMHQISFLKSLLCISLHS